jgi:hypothetical protein
LPALKNTLPSAPSPPDKTAAPAFPPPEFPTKSICAALAYPLSPPPVKVKTPELFSLLIPNGEVMIMPNPELSPKVLPPLITPLTDTLLNSASPVFLWILHPWTPDEKLLESMSAPKTIPFAVKSTRVTD